MIIYVNPVFSSIHSDWFTAEAHEARPLREPVYVTEELQGLGSSSTWMADHILSTSKPLKCSWTFWIIFPHETALLIEVKPDVLTQIDINVYMYTNI